MVKRLQRHQREIAAGLVNNMRERSCILRGRLCERALGDCGLLSLHTPGTSCTLSRALPGATIHHPGTSKNNARKLVKTFSFEPSRVQH